MLDSVVTSEIVASVFELSEVNGMDFSFFGQTRKGLIYGTCLNSILQTGADNFLFEWDEFSADFVGIKVSEVGLVKTWLVVVVVEDKGSFVLSPYSLTGEQIVTAFITLNLPVTNVFLDKICEVNSTRQTLGPAI